MAAPPAQILRLSRPVVYKPIPEADNGLDLRAGVAKLRAQAADMHVDRACFDEPVVTPHALQQAVARYHAVLVLNEIVQQLELAAGEAHRLSVDSNRNGVEIGGEMRAAVRGGRPLCLAARSPEHRSDARRQLPKAERLRYVIVRAEFEAADAVIL